MPTPTVPENVNIIFNKIRSKHHEVSVSKIWIAEQLRNGMSNADLLYKKWLVTDISQTFAEPIPPESISMEISKHHLPGPFTLQLISIMDVGSSCFSQLKKLRGKPVTESNQNTSHFNDPPPSKMMLLSLTDGTNVISAMEFKPCSQFSVNLLPGTKLVISNVTCRIGMLLLEPGNFRILGGCVEALRAQYSQEHVLNAVLDGDSEDVTDDVTTNVIHQETNSAQDQNTAGFDGSHQGVRALRANGANGNNHRSSSNQPQNIDSSSSGSVKQTRHNSIDGLRSVSSNQKNTPQPTIQHPEISSSNMNQTEYKQQTPTSVPNVHLPLEESTNPYFNTMIKPESNCPVPASMPDVNNLQTQGELSGFVDSLTAEFFEPIEESNLKRGTHIPIKDLNPNLEFPVHIAATVSSLLSKLTPVPEWTVKARLTDFTGNLECRLSESLLSKMIGYTSRNFTELKPVSSTNPSVKTFLRQGLESCQKQLIFLTGVFSIQPNSLPVTSSEFEVISLEKLEVEDEEKLKSFVKGKCNVV